MRGNTYVAGTTRSADFPAANAPAQTASQNAPKLFVTKFNPSGKAEFSLVIGGSSSYVRSFSGPRDAVQESGRPSRRGIANISCLILH
jgi:hypothetical protein